MKPTRILFLYSTLTVGGAERQVALLLPRLREKGFDPVVVTLRHRGRYFEELRDGGIPTACVEMRSRWDVRGAVRAYRLWTTRPEIVFTQSVNAQVIGQLIARRAGAFHVTEEQGGAGLRRRLYQRLLTRIVARRVHTVVAVSESQIPDLVRLGYRRPSIVVLPNAVPELQPTRDRNEVRAELRIRDGEVLVLLVSVLRPEKRADVFVEAVKKAHERNPRVRGIVAGGGPQLEHVRAHANAIVRVLGERSDVPDLMSAADVVCLSSDVEGLPMTVLEAMALGRPVIATAVGGVRDAVVDGGTGWLVPPGDPSAFAKALLELAASPDRADALGAAAKQRFRERYTIERRVQGYADLFHSIVGAEH